MTNGLSKCIGEKLMSMRVCLGYFVNIRIAKTVVNSYHYLSPVYNMPTCFMVVLRIPTIVDKRMNSYRRFFSSIC